jgi:DNA mismatch repair protein MSH4
MTFASVPADFASIKIQDAVLTRLSNDDSIERSLSTFAQEMATSAMILGRHPIQA